MTSQIDLTYQLVDKFLNEAPHEEVEALFKKIDDMNIQGPTINEYMITQTFIMCNGEINNTGYCNKCGGKSQISSNRCIQPVEINPLNPATN